MGLERLSVSRDDMYEYIAMYLHQLNEDFDSIPEEVSRKSALTYARVISLMDEGPLTQNENYLFLTPYSLQLKGGQPPAMLETLEKVWGYLEGLNVLRQQVVSVNDGDEGAVLHALSVWTTNESCYREGLAPQ